MTPLEVIDWRTFLRAASLTAVGVAGAARVMGAERQAERMDVPPTQVTDDPVAAQAEALEYDRDARYFRFVADEIAYEPYAGMLRGPRATLTGRAGNAADKAALLAALLEASLIGTRFVVGPLDDASAAALAATTVDPGAARARATSVLADEVPPAAHGDVAAPEVQAVIDRLPGIDQAVTAWASAAIDDSVRTIVGALADAGIRLPVGAPDRSDVERARHVWVQAAHGSEWLDLDPTLPGSEAGRTMATPTAEPVAVLPDGLRHRIDIVVTAEHIAGSGLAEEVLIERSMFADELTEIRFSISHAKPEGLKGLGVSIEQSLTGGVRYQADPRSARQPSSESRA